MHRVCDENDDGGGDDEDGDENDDGEHGEYGDATQRNSQGQDG